MMIIRIIKEEVMHRKFHFIIIFLLFGKSIYSNEIIFLSSPFAHDPSRQEYAAIINDELMQEEIEEDGLIQAICTGVVDQILFESNIGQVHIRCDSGMEAIYPALQATIVDTGENVLKGQNIGTFKKSNYTTRILYFNFNEDFLNIYPQFFENEIIFPIEEGNSVYAADSGLILESSFDRDLGLYVRIRHRIFDVIYAHLQTISEYPGKELNVGHIIGKTGYSGFSEYPMLRIILLSAESSDYFYAVYLINPHHNE